jgi:hypothetical protein
VAAKNDVRPGLVHASVVSGTWPKAPYEDPCNQRYNNGGHDTMMYLHLLIKVISFLFPCFHDALRQIGSPWDFIVGDEALAKEEEKVTEVLVLNNIY